MFLFIKNLVEFFKVPSYDDLPTTIATVEDPRIAFSSISVVGRTQSGHRIWKVCVQNLELQ